MMMGGGMNMGPGGGHRRRPSDGEEFKKNINYRGGAGLGDIDPAAINGINYE
jgi:hypothetical protein